MSTMTSTKKDIHLVIERFTRTLHDGVEQCESEIGLLVMAQMIHNLVVLLDKMIDGIEVKVISTFGEKELS